MCGGHGVSHGGPFQRDERNYVGRAYAGMHAGVSMQIDQFRCSGRAANGGFHYGVGLTREGEDAAVMVRVHLLAQEDNSGRAADGSRQSLDHFRVAAFGKVRNAL